jgi:hypothetical protein
VDVLPVLRALARHPLGRFTLALARRIATAVYFRQRQYITVQRIGATTEANALTADRKMQCVTLSSREALTAIAAHIPAAFRDSVADLDSRVANGCVLTLAFRRADDGDLEIVGYELAERGVFSALGRRHPAPPDVVFSHWAEVLPAYRGQRVHALLFATRDAYFQERGGKFVWGVVAPKNRASLQALRRAGSFVVGAVSRVSLFSGLIAWETPPQRIEQALRLLDT